jgi:glycosyltransferase involved in cell wall biosynthesis
MTPIRVAYVQSHLSYGSVEEYLHSLVDRVDRERFEPWLVCSDHPSLEPLQQAPGLEGRVVVVPGGASLPRFLETRSRALRSINPGLVHCADLDAPGMLAAARRRCVVTYNTPELRPRYNAAGRVAMRAAWATKPWVVFTSERDRESGVALDPIPRERTEVIPYGLDTARFAPRDRTEARAALGLSPESRVVGTVGRLNAQKGHTYLLQAAERLAERRSDIEWVIAGDGELRARIEDEARLRGLEHHVRFLGHRKDVPEILAALDVFVLSSNFEGMCFAVAEALAVGVPVVATDVGGVSQSVVDGETGLLVPPRDATALADAIERLVDDGDAATRLGRAGRKRVEELYDLSKMAAATERLYARVLAA